MTSRAVTTLDEARRLYPTGSTVSYRDLTLRPRRKARTGTLEAIREGTGEVEAIVATVRIGDSVLTTLIDNLTLIRTPGSTITPKDNPLDQ